MTWKKYFPFIFNQIKNFDNGNSGDALPSAAFISAFKVGHGNRQRPFLHGNNIFRG